MTKLSIIPTRRSRASLWNDDVDSLFNSMLQSFGSTAWPTVSDASFGNALIRWDFSENETGYTLHADLPGVTKDKLDVALDDDILTIKGEKETSAQRTENQVHISERSYGSFSRSLRLPSDVDTDNIEVNLKDGVLNIQLPKLAEAQQKTRKLTVK